MPHNAINRDKAQRTGLCSWRHKNFYRMKDLSKQISCTHVHGKWREGKKDTYKLIFLPRLSNSSKNISKSTPPCRTDLLTSTNTVITKDSRLVCVQAVNTVQLMTVTDHSLTYGLIISINVKHQSTRVTYVLQSK